MQERFVVEYVKNGRYAEKAAVAAGWSPTTAYARAHECLRDPAVRRRLAEIEVDSLRRQNIDVDLVMKQIVVRATTPVTEAIGDVVVPPCRSCWGINNLYQYTFSELEDKLEKWNADKSRSRGPFDQRGGDGYDVLAPPNPDCPNCRGLGDIRNPVSVPKDTRFMSPEGRMLLAGYKISKGTYEVLVRNQDAASAQLLGVVKDIMELRAAGDAPQAFDLKPQRFGDGRSQHARITAVRRIVVDPVVTYDDDAS